jgi:hypothetical protein
LARRGSCQPAGSDVRGVVDGLFSVHHYRKSSPSHFELLVGLKLGLSLGCDRMKVDSETEANGWVDEHKHEIDLWLRCQRALVGGDRWGITWGVASGLVCLGVLAARRAPTACCIRRGEKWQPKLNLSRDGNDKAN